MSEIRQFLVDGYDWETFISIDVKGKKDTQIYKELCDKALEFFKDNPKKLKLSVMMGFYMKISEKELPKSDIGVKRLFDGSSLIKTKKKLFFGKVESVQITNEQIR